jgi:hypothetical protein
MAENEQLPAWLADLREQQLGEQPREQPHVAEGLPAQMGQADLMADSLEQVPEADMLEDLREQMIQAEGELEAEEERRKEASLVQSLLDLAPGQRLLLAVLLFLNVAVCGCMALLMAGRVVLPF